MLAIRHAEDRGLAKLGRLDSRHTFSFGQFYDPQFMGFGHLRVINEDRVQPGQGFDTHGHKDMEIISYVLEGALEHKDSIGTGSVIRPGEVQRMSAGTGIQHSEFNHSDSEIVHFLQIWILPEHEGLEPSYEQTVGSRDGREGSVTIHQDVDLYATLLTENQAVTHDLVDGRKGWVQVTRGTIKLEEQQLYPGDGVAIDAAGRIQLTGTSDAEVLLFDMGA
ncbi:MAG: pirin family protein [Planctomycetota bacterium]|jgi:redox-sensitive bicupin YhaK (pirin superfamily)